MILQRTHHTQVGAASICPENYTDHNYTAMQTLLDMFIILQNFSIKIYPEFALTNGHQCQWNAIACHYHLAITLSGCAHHLPFQLWHSKGKKGYYLLESGSFSKLNVTVEEICITVDRLCQPEHICSHIITQQERIKFCQSRVA